MKKITFYVLMMLATVVVAQNNSLNFDGQDDSVNLGQNFGFEVGDAFTVEAWVNYGVMGSFQQIVAKLGNGQFFFRGWGFQITEEGWLSAYVATEFFTDFRFVEGTQVLQIDQWYHVAMTYDGADTLQLFINGVEEPLGNVNNSGTLTTIATTAPTRIGSFGEDNGQQEHLFGNIDELRIWNGIRTPAEIAANYQTELSGTEAGLLGYYKMDVSDSACDVEDCNSNQSHGVREGDLGTNVFPQFSENIPSISDVACGAAIDCTLAVETLEQVEISLYPNPTSGLLNISGVPAHNVEVVVYDMQGSVVTNTILLNNTIDLSSLLRGIYFVQLSNEQFRVTRKIVVN